MDLVVVGDGVGSMIGGWIVIVLFAVIAVVVGLGVGGCVTGEELFEGVGRACGGD